MRAEKPARGELIIFLPFDARGTPCLAAEEPSLGGVGKKAVGGVALCGYVGVEGLIAELGSQKALRAGQVAVLYVHLIAALVKIRRRGLRCEGVEPEVVEFLRVQRKRHRRGLLRADDEIDLAIRIE